MKAEKTLFIVFVLPCKFDNENNKVVPTWTGCDMYGVTWHFACDRVDPGLGKPAETNVKITNPGLA